MNRFSRRNRLDRSVAVFGVLVSVKVADLEYRRNLQVAGRAVLKELGVGMILERLDDPTGVDDFMSGLGIELERVVKVTTLDSLKEVFEVQEGRRAGPEIGQTIEVCVEESRSVHVLHDGIRDQIDGRIKGLHTKLFEGVLDGMRVLLVAAYNRRKDVKGAAG
jgi:hypothetical protein